MDSPGSKHMTFGSLWFIGGLLVTLATWTAAQDGGVVVVAYGAMIAGALEFLIGLVNHIRATH